MEEELSLENIEKTNKPKLLKNLFAKNKIHSFKELKEKFGDVDIEVNKNYYDGYKDLELYSCKLKDYIDLSLEHNNSFDLYCSEQDLPSTIYDDLNFSNSLNSILNSNHTFRFFVGKQNSIAPIHFDWDSKHVLLTELFGTKKVVLFPPKEAKKLQPILNMSSLSFHSFSKQTRDDFIKYANGVEITLKAGDSLFFPKHWWHFVEYEEFSLSFNIRFSSSSIENKLTTLPRNYLIQNILYSLYASKSLEEESSELVEILKLFYSKKKSPYMRYKKLINKYRKLYHKFVIDNIGKYTLDDFDIENLVYKKEIKSLYNPKITFDYLMLDENITSREILELSEKFSDEELKIHCQSFGIKNYQNMKYLDYAIIMNSY